mmetsp:Transcript_14933/g.26508  ORF Transcript_14933/g.26508 Transcript_14933/m.26508 type:complete len:232 (-) Transcript_14933:158-853(-)
MWNIHPSFTQGEVPEFPGPCAFLCAWIKIGCGDFCKLYNCLLLPVFYISGIFWFIMKVLFLNQPGLEQCRSVLRVEADIPLPGLNSQERLEFAKKWYSFEPRPAPFDNKSGVVSSKFTHVAKSSLWLELVAFHRCLMLPPMTNMAVFHEDRWLLTFPWWCPHMMEGWAIIEENSSKPGILVEAEFQCWWILRPIYEFLAKSVFSLYVNQLKACGKSGMADQEDAEAPGASA